MKIQQNRIVILIAGVFALLLLGVIYAWSVFVAPLEAAFGWQRSQTSTVFTLSMCFFCIGGMLGGALTGKLGPKNVLRLSALSLLLGFSCAATFASLPGLYIGYGVLCGLGVGMGYNAVLGCVVKWFPEKPGFCNGVLLMGFGSGALALSAVCTALMGALGWRTTFYILAAAFAVLLFGCSLFLRAPQAAAARAGGTVELTTAEMVKLPSFYLLLVWLSILAAGGVMVIGSAAPMARDAGAGEAFSALAPGLIAVCNGGGRVLFGTLFDKIGWKKTMLLVNACNLAAMLTLGCAFLFASLPLFALGCCLTGVSYGGCPVVCTAFTNRMYGPLHYVTNVALTNIHAIPASLLGSQLTGMLYTRLGSYAPMLWGFAVAALIPLYCLYRIRETQPKAAAEAARA